MEVALTQLGQTFAPRGRRLMDLQRQGFRGRCRVFTGQSGSNKSLYEGTCGWGSVGIITVYDITPLITDLGTTLLGAISITRAVASVGVHREALSKKRADLRYFHLSDK